MSNSLFVMKDKEALSQLNQCINFWQPYKLVVVPQPWPLQKCLNRERGGEREREDGLIRLSDFGTGLLLLQGW